MGDIHAALEVSQTVFAAFSCLYFLGAQFKQNKSRYHDTTLFIWLLVAKLLVSGGEAAITIIQIGGMPSILPLATSLVHIFALLLQIDHLWANTAQQTQPAWHAHLGSWTIMAVLDILAVVELAIVPQSSKLNLIYGAVATSLRCCLGLALLIGFALPDQGGYIRLSDSIEEDTTAIQDNLGNGSGGKRLESLALGHSVNDMIHAAGGPWLWAKSFCIFLPWIWPSDLPWVKLYVFASLLLRLGDMLLTLYIPYAQGEFAESAMQAFMRKDLGPVWRPLALLMAVRLANSGSGLTSLQQLLWQTFKFSREERAKTCIYTHLMLHETAFHDVVSPTDVSTATKLGMDVCSALDFIVLNIVPQVLTFLGAIMTILSLYGPHVALVQGFIVAINMLLLLRSHRALMPIYDAQLTAIQDTERWLQGGLRSWRTVSLFGQTDYEIKSYTTSLKMQLRLTWKRFLVNFGFRLASGITLNIGHFAITVLVVLHGLQAGGTIGSVIAFSGYWSLLQNTLFFFTQVPAHIIEELYNADRLRRILLIKPTMTYGKDSLRSNSGRVEFVDVSFQILKNLSLVFEAGKTTALVGPSGVGKSTVAALARRHYDPTEGAIIIDDQDIRTLRLNELSKLITVKTQNPQIFNRTVKDNIRYGRAGATDQEVHDAATSAGIHARIMTLPEQYDTVVGEGGGFLSGGELQRLALARVLIQRPNILIFDEATSALDADTENHIKNSIQNLFPNATKIIIAASLRHRLSSIKHADKIIVLRKGPNNFSEIAEEGNHNELVKLDGLYARLWRNHIGAVQKMEPQEMSIEVLYDQ